MKNIHMIVIPSLLRIFHFENGEIFALIQKKLIDFFLLFFKYLLSVRFNNLSIKAKFSEFRNH